MIEFKDVHFGFSNLPIFQNLNVCIPPGGIVWIQGGNGGGKTTFLRLILDFLRPQSGKISITKGTRFGWGPAVDNSFFPRINGEENLKFFLSLANQVNAFAGRLDFYFQKDELVDRILKTRFYQMSSGMKQILILMRAMMANPDFILLDEPMRGLDQQHQILFLNLISKLTEAKKTVIITSHLPLMIEMSQIRVLKINDLKIH